MTKKTYLEQMGLKPVNVLNKKICVARVKHLRQQIKQNKFKGKLLEKAKYYANWYSWMAENGGGRGTKRRAS